jgi:hypothetical protein
MTSPQGPPNGPIYDIDFVETIRPAAALLNKGSNEEKLEFIGRRLFFIPRNPPKPPPGDQTQSENGGQEASREQSEYMDKIKKSNGYLSKFLEHLERKKVMLLQGEAGSGKTTLVEEIALLYVSAAGKHEEEEGEEEDEVEEGRFQEGYIMVTNGCNTLTEQKLFGYKAPNGLMYKGPIEKMKEDAEKNKKSRFVFILHEWNRVAEFMRCVNNKPKGEVLAAQATYSLDMLFCGLKSFRELLRS